VYSLGPLGHVPSATWPRPRNADGKSAVPKRSKATGTIKPRRATKTMDADNEEEWPELTEGGVLKGSSFSWQRSYRSFNKQLPLWQCDEPKKRRKQREEAMQSQITEADSNKQEGKKRGASKKQSLASGDVVSQTHVHLDMSKHAPRHEGLPQDVDQHARERELELRRKHRKKPLILLQELLRMGGTTVTSTPLDEIWVLIRYTPQLREPENAGGRANVRKLENEHKDLADTSAVRAPAAMEPAEPAEPAEAGSSFAPTPATQAPAPSPYVAATASLPVAAPLPEMTAAPAASPPKNTAVWRYVNAEHVQVPGKVSPDDLMALLSAGTIELRTLVWKPKMANWTELRYVPELREALRNRPRTEKEIWQDAVTTVQAIIRGKLTRLNAHGVREEPEAAFRGGGDEPPRVGRVGAEAVLEAFRAPSASWGGGESSSRFSARDEARSRRSRLTRTEESVRRTHALRHSRTEESVTQALRIEESESTTESSYDGAKLLQLPSSRDIDVPTASPRFERPPSARGGPASARGGRPSERHSQANEPPSPLNSRHSRNAIDSFFETDSTPLASRHSRSAIDSFFETGAPSDKLDASIHEVEEHEEDSPLVAANSAPEEAGTSAAASEEAEVRARAASRAKIRAKARAPAASCHPP